MDYNKIPFKNAAVDRLSGNTTQPPLITKNRAQAARDMRKGVTPMQNADGTTSTHVMAGGEGGSGKFKYTVNPTVFPNNGGKTWTDTAPKITVKNLMSGKPVEIDADTPWCCNPASETYWSM